MDASALRVRGNPRIVVASGDSATVENSVRQSAPERASIWVIDGERCSTLDGLDNELVQKLRLPPYYGHNWNALDECLADMEGLPATHHFLLVKESQHLLSLKPEFNFPVFMDVLRHASAGWEEDHRDLVYKSILQVPHRFLHDLQSALSSIKDYKIPWATICMEAGKADTSSRSKPGG